MDDDVRKLVWIWNFASFTNIIYWIPVDELLLLLRTRKWAVVRIPIFPNRITSKKKQL